jgi:hypothetical protein
MDGRCAVHLLQNFTRPLYGRRWSREKNKRNNQEAPPSQDAITEPKRTEKSPLTTWISHRNRLSPSTPWQQLIPLLQGTAPDILFYKDRICDETRTFVSLVASCLARHHSVGHCCSTLGFEEVNAIGESDGLRQLLSRDGRIESRLVATGLPTPTMTCTVEMGWWCGDPG